MSAFFVIFYNKFFNLNFAICPNITQFKLKHLFIKNLKENRTIEFELAINVNSVEVISWLRMDLLWENKGINAKNVEKIL